MLRVSSPLTADQEKIVAEVVDCGVTVHRVLGPGFREKIYARAFASSSTAVSFDSSAKSRSSFATRIGQSRVRRWI